MKITIGKWCFTPGLVTSVLFLLFFVLFFRLGLWQLDRAEYKADRYSTFQQRQKATPRQLSSIEPAKSVEDIIWQRVAATGEFESISVLLDNRVINGKVGYFVYSPFRIEDSDDVVLVNRGWVEAPDSREIVPALLTTSGKVKISGDLKAEPRTGILLSEAPAERMANDVYRVQEINLEKLTVLLDTNLLPYILRLDESSSHGYRLEWSMPGSDEQMHRGYAYQWFAFAITLLIIYLVLNTRKK